MQGREHKHEVLKRLLRNTQAQQKWGQVFLYDEVICHFLPVELGFPIEGYRISAAIKKRAAPSRFIPKIANESVISACGSADCTLCYHSEGRLYMRVLTELCQMWN